MNDKTRTKCTIQNVICCGVFEQTFKNYQWFSMMDADNKKVLVMPCFPDKKIRINHCPSCGKYIRDIQVPIDVFNHYI